MAKLAAVGYLSAKKEGGIDALLRSGSVREAAALSGISGRTLRRWLREDPAFREEYEARRAEVLEGGSGRLADGFASAAGVLLEEMRTATTSSARIRAATNVITLALRAHAQLDLEPRLQALEQALQEAQDD